MSGYRSISILAALMLAFTREHAVAQFPERVQNGTRVRVWIPEAHRQEGGPWRRQLLRGTVALVSADTLRLSVPGTEGTLAVPCQSIRRLDISRGRPSRVASAIERAFAFAVVGAISTALNDGEWRAADEGAAWGAGVGAAIGFILPTERWRRVRLRR